MNENEISFINPLNIEYENEFIESKSNNSIKKENEKNKYIKNEKMNENSNKNETNKSLNGNTMSLIKQWKCTQCTLNNDFSSLRCIVCNTKRQRNIKDTNKRIKFQEMVFSPETF